MHINRGDEDKPHGVVPHEDHQQVIVVVFYARAGRRVLPRAAPSDECAGAATFERAAVHGIPCGHGGGQRIEGPHLLEGVEVNVEGHDEVDDVVYKGLYALDIPREEGEGSVTVEVQWGKGVGGEGTGPRGGGYQQSVIWGITGATWLDRGRRDALDGREAGDVEDRP